MTKQDIRRMYTEKVTELLNQGYTIFPDAMGGSQGEIAHIDLTNGSEILRVLLQKDMCRNIKGFYGDKIVLTVGKADPDTRIYDNWDGTIWNNHLEPRFQIEWAELSTRGRDRDRYITMDEAERIGQIRRQRYISRLGDTLRREELGDAYKSVALRWLRKQPGMKTCRPAEIEAVERVRDDKGERSFEIRARGKRFTLR